MKTPSADSTRTAPQSQLRQDKTCIWIALHSSAFTLSQDVIISDIIGAQELIIIGNCLNQDCVEPLLDFTVTFTSNPAIFQPEYFYFLDNAHEFLAYVCNPT